MVELTCTILKSKSMTLIPSRILVKTLERNRLSFLQSFFGLFPRRNIEENAAHILNAAILITDYLASFLNPNKIILAGF